MLTRWGKKKRQRILVVDQDDPTRELLANIIKLLGCDFELAASVEEAFSVLDKSPFDLLITDLQLPESQKLVENSVQRSPGMRAICMVRHRQVLRQTYPLGGAVLIPKPFNFDDMIDKIRQSIHEKNLNDVEAEFRRLRREVFRILT